MKNVKILALTVAFAAAFAFSTPSFAICKGKSASSCKGDDSCVWVGSFKRMGKTVSSYCRSKPSARKKGRKIAGEVKKRAKAKKENVAKKARKSTRKSVKGKVAKKAKKTRRKATRKTKR